MMRPCIGTLLLAPVVFLCAQARGAEDEPSREKLVEIGKPATALVECISPGGRAYGCAFCLHPSGLFVTNAQIVNAVAIPNISLILGAGQKTQRVVSARVVREDKEKDLALLRAEGVKDLPALSLGGIDGLRETEEVVAFGFPFETLRGDLFNQYPAVGFNAGNITCLRYKGGVLNHIQVDAVFTAGNSGGPVLDAKGKVIGVAARPNSAIRAAGINFLIPVSRLTAFLAVPDLEFKLPTVAQSDIHKEVVVEARVLALVPQTKQYRLELLLAGADGKERKAAMTEKDGVYQARVIPVPPPPLRVTVTYNNGSVTGNIVDRTVQVDGKERRLSQLRLLRWQPKPQVLLDDGKIVDGVVTGLGVLEVAPGKEVVRLDLASAVEVKFEAASSPSHVACTLVAFQEDKEVGRISSDLTFASPAGPAVENPGNIVPPAAEKQPSPLPAEIVAAWQKAGAEVGWLGVNHLGSLEFRVGGKGKEGEAPAFRFAEWKGGLSELPRPQTGFGLSLRGKTVTDAVLKDLAWLTSLQALELSFTGVTDAGLKELAGLRSLQSLNLSNTKVTDAGLKELAGLKALRLLNLSSTQVGNAGLKDLVGLKSLRTLYLGATKVTDAGLKDLARIESLQALYLDLTPVTDVGLKELVGLKALQSLGLGNTQATDAGLKDLAELKSLQSLDLSFTKVTNNGLKELAGLKSLRSLDLTSTKTTDAGIAALQAAVPGLKVER
jgi:Trypsin-like peptidase domain/Leucine rich repeat/Leucine Rich repeat